MDALILEDDGHRAASLKRRLEEAGYDVDAASIGRETLVWDGGIPFGARTPILTLTTGNCVDDRGVGLDAGASAVARLARRRTTSDGPFADRRGRLAGASSKSGRAARRSGDVVR